jgi:hypothetical protein
VVTASRDRTVRIWSLPIDMGSLEDWRVIARCSPFALVDGLLTPNPDPTRSAQAALWPGDGGGELVRRPGARDSPGLHGDIRRICLERIA